MANIVFLGLSITSSWGNGHATTYRALLKALAARGHEVTFLEREAPWYSEHRDLSRMCFAKVGLYYGLGDLKRRFTHIVEDADAVIVGSFVPDGIEVGEWVVATASGLAAFYDIDTPVTLAALRTGQCSYLSEELVAAYDLYLSFTGGPTLDLLHDLGSPKAAALYCCVDPKSHGLVATRRKWEVGYLGTHSADRQLALERTLFALARMLPAKYFVVAGPQYPEDVRWPANVQHISHLPPNEHSEFYCAQKFTLNLTRADMRQFGFSPSVRLFEAAACGVPIITDNWPGLSTLFEIGKEILVADTADEIMRILETMSAARRKSISAAAHRRVMLEHTAAHRAAEFEGLLDLASRKTVSNRLQRRALAT
jgi:spore maturation protein CgeB